MAWQDRFKAGTFRGVTFHIESHRYKSGRRVQDHEFPFLQRNYAEDLGKRTNQFEINCYILGPDYDMERDKMTRALEQAGSGILSHPYLGVFDVKVQGFELSEDRDNLGFCRFRVQFIEAGSQIFPGDDIDESNSLNEQANGLKASSLNLFQRIYSNRNLPVTSLQALRDTVNGFLSFVDTIKQGQGALLQGLSELELTIQSFGASANQLRLLPGAMIDGIVGVVDSLESSFSTASGRFVALITLSGKEEVNAPAFGSTSSEQDARNQMAVNMLFRVRPLAGAILAANEIEYRSRAEAFRYRDQFLKSIDSLMNTNITIQDELVAALPLEVLEQLQDLRSLVVRRFPFFNSVAATAIEKEFKEEVNGVVALFQITKSTEGLDFFLQDNDIFDGFAMAGKPVRAERQLA